MVEKLKAITIIKLNNANDIENYQSFELEFYS